MYKKLFTLIALVSLVTGSLRASGLGLESAVNQPSAERSTRSKAGKKGCPTCAANGQTNSPADQLEGLAALGNKSKLSMFVTVNRSSLAGATVNFVGTATYSRVRSY